MNKSVNDIFRKELEQMIAERAKGYINYSSTYDDALKKAKSSGLCFKHGELGAIIDSCVIKMIVNQALRGRNKEFSNE